MVIDEECAERVLRPRAVAIVGASDRSPFGVRVHENLINTGYTGDIVLVNPTRDEVFGRPCYPSLRDAPPVDVSILLVARELVEAAVDDAIAAGCAGIVVFAVGFRDSGEPEWRAIEERIAHRVREAGCVLVGPNCLGVLFEPTHFAGLGAPVFWPVRPGSIALAMQSGALLHSAVRCLDELGAGVRYAVSTGNGTAFSIAEWAALFAAQDDVSTIGLLVEEFGGDWAVFAEAAAAARSAGKRIIVLKLGRTDVGQAVAQSHTGALAGEYAVIRDALRQVGAEEAASYGEFLGALALQERFGKPVAAGVAMFSPTGGTNGLTADIAADQGVAIADLTSETRASLHAIPDFNGTVNPLDLNDRWSFDPEMIERAVATALADPGVAAGVYCAATLPDKHMEPLIEMLERIGRVAAEVGKPVLLTEVGFGRVDPVLERFLEDYPWTIRLPNTRDAMGALRLWVADERSPPQRAIVEPADAPVQWSDEYELKQMLVKRLGDGILVPRSTLLPWPAEADHLGRAVNGDREHLYFLKAIGPELLHRSKLGLIEGPVAAVDAPASLAGLEETADRTGADIASLLIEEAAPAGTDLIVGVTRQPLGLAVMIGRGGVSVEELATHRFAVLPAPPEYVEGLVATALSGTGAERGPGVATIARIARALADLADEAGLTSIECNPLRVTPDGSVWVLDALALR